MSNSLQDNQILDSFKAVIPYLPVLFNEDVSIGLADTEKHIVAGQSKELQLNITAGSPIPKGGAVFEALETGKTVIKTVPKEVYGVPFQSYAIPISSGGKIVGVFVVGKSLTNKHNVQNAVRGITEALQQISEAVNEISSGLQQVEDKNKAVLSMAIETSKQASGTDEILSFIQEVSFMTNILGLNASIEAARAGKYGTGFNVVAKEIRNLSNSTSGSVEKIGDLLKLIKTSIDAISKSFSESNSIFESQASSLKEIVSSIDELKNSLQVLESLSERL